MDKVAEAELTETSIEALEFKRHIAAQISLDLEGIIPRNEENVNCWGYAPFTSELHPALATDAPSALARQSGRSGKSASSCSGV